METQKNNQPTKKDVLKDMKLEWNSSTYYQKFKTIMTMLIIIMCGMVIVNQFYGFHNKLELTKTPCNLCVKQYPIQKQCIVGCINGERVIGNSDNNSYLGDFNISMIK